MFALIVAILLPDAHMQGTAVLDDLFETRAACEAKAEAEVAKAVEFLTRQHGRVIVQSFKCVPQDMLKPGTDA